MYGTSQTSNMATFLPLNLNAVDVPAETARFVTYTPEGPDTDGFNCTVCRIEVRKNAINWSNPLKPSGITSVSAGSGFVMKVFGKTIAIITNEHVIHDYDITIPGAITVTFPKSGSHKIEAELIGTSPEHDLALLRIKKAKKKLPWFGDYVLEAGGPADVAMGVALHVLGYPLGQEGLAFTQGVISGYQWVNGTHYIYSDTTINHGNSGGAALVKVAGTYRVVGVPTAIIEGAQNAGYITPFAVVERFLHNFQHLYRESKDLPVFVPRPVLAMRLESMSDIYMGLIGSSNPNGLFVNSISPGSLFSDVLQAEDQLVSINGAAIDDVGQTQPEGTSAPLSLSQVVNGMGYDDTATVGLIRSGHHMEVEVKYDAYMDPRKVKPRYKFDHDPVNLALVGELVFQDLTLNLVESLGAANPYIGKWSHIDEQINNPVVIYSDRIGNTMKAPAPPLILSTINGQAVTSAASIPGLLNVKAQQFHRIKFADGSLVVIKSHELQESADIDPITEVATTATKHTSITQVTAQRFERSLCQHLPGACDCAIDIGVAADQLSELIGNIKVSTSHDDVVRDIISDRRSSADHRREIDEVELGFLRESLPLHLLQELGYS